MIFKNTLSITGLQVTVPKRVIMKKRKVEIETEIDRDRDRDRLMSREKLGDIVGGK